MVTGHCFSHDCELGFQGYSSNGVRADSSQVSKNITKLAVLTKIQSF